MQFGRYFEEFEVGAVYKHWPGKTVTEYDDHLFCLITMNHHPLHLDAHYAEGTQQGRNVVVGNYVYSLLLGMSVADVSGKAIANLEVESLRHVKPVFHGDTIYGESTVLDKKESSSKNDRGVVQVETIGYNQDGVVVCIYRRKVMVPKRPAAEGTDEPEAEQPRRPVPQRDGGRRSAGSGGGSPTRAGGGEAGDEVAGGVEGGVGRGVHPPDVGGVVAGAGAAAGSTGRQRKSWMSKTRPSGASRRTAPDLVADDDGQAGLLGDLAGRGRGRGLARLDPPAGQRPPAGLGRVRPADQEQAAGGVGDDAADAGDTPAGTRPVRPTVTLRHTRSH